MEASAEATAKLAELEPPADDEDDFRAYLAERSAQQETAAAAVRALESGDGAAFRAADLALLHHDRRMRGYEARLGLDICAQDLSDEAEDAVREVLEEAFLESEPDCDVFTPYFVRKALGSGGGLRDCWPTTCFRRRSRSAPCAAQRARSRRRRFTSRAAPTTAPIYGVRLLYDRWSPAISDLLRISRRPPPAGS